MAGDADQPDSAEFRRVLAEARAGSIAAIGTLLEWRRVLLEWHIAAHLPRALQSKVAVSDIFQDVAIEVRRDFRSFLGGSEGEFFNWLKSIVTHTLHDTIRHYDGTQKRDTHREKHLGDGSGSTADEDLLEEVWSPDMSAMRREEIAILAAMIRTLPDDYRTVITLRCFENLTFKEIGTRMGRSEDAARKLWGRACAELVRLMREHDQGGGGHTDGTSDGGDAPTRPPGRPHD